MRHLLCCKVLKLNDELRFVVKRRECGMRLNVILRAGVCAWMLWMVVGCSPTRSLEQSFAEAPQTLRLSVEEAIRLDRNNDWMRAAESYDRVLRGELTQEQQRRVQSAIHSLYARMVKAAAAGDSQAQITLEKIEKHRRGRS